mgnify:CR=1 FL=1
MNLVKPSYVIESEIDGEKILRHIEKAARTCYKTEGKAGDIEKTKKFVRMLVKNGHHSTLEHYSISVRFIVDRGVTHELVRHRLCAYSQESTRYCNYSDDQFGNNVTYIIPPWVDIPEGEYYFNEPSNIQVIESDYLWFEACLESEEFYNSLLKTGWSPQQARAVLPNSLKTEIVTTANLREWRHIFGMRAVGIAGKPHPQMLEIMVPLLKEFKEKIPVIYDDLEVK